MIVVIADDLTGAAELGGLALRYNLAAEITSVVNPASKADLLIIATDTRSLSKEEAEQVIEKLSDDLERLKPALIFKKIDSVLRGHVLAEIHVQKNKLNLKRALIVPGNPRLGRTVVDGVYLLNGQPVHLSSFSEDPEFPVRSSQVHKMLGSEDDTITVLKHQDDMGDTGIIVGEVKDSSDLDAWCKKIDAHTLVAGAAEFFTAILEHLDIKPALKKNYTATLQLPALMICGSSFQKSYVFINKMEKQGLPVRYMPEEILNSELAHDEMGKRWMDETIGYLNRFGKVIIAPDPALKSIASDALALRTKMAEAAALVATHVHINECLIEGGSTAAAVMRELGIETLFPIQELAPGVIRMRVKGRKDLHVTLKPGSYDWPPRILHPEMVEGAYEIDCSVY